MAIRNLFATVDDLRVQNKILMGRNETVVEENRRLKTRNQQLVDLLKALTSSSSVARKKTDEETAEEEL